MAGESLADAAGLVGTRPLEAVTANTRVRLVSRANDQENESEQGFEKREGGGNDETRRRGTKWGKRGGLDHRQEKINAWWGRDTFIVLSRRWHAERRGAEPVAASAGTCHLTAAPTALSPRDSVERAMEKQLSTPFRVVTGGLIIMEGNGLKWRG